MSIRAVFPEYIVPIQGQWQKIQNKAVEAMPLGQRELIDNYIYQYQQNPLAFSLAHGRPRNDGTTDVQAMCNNREVDLAILTAGNQMGKAQPLDTVIPTPTGETTMGDLKVGDNVIGGDGKPCKVLEVHEHPNRECYELTFDNDEVTTECVDDHLWVYLRHKRSHKLSSRYNEWETVSLKQIMDIQGCDVNPKKAGYIPACKPVEFDSVESFPLKPYTLGCLIGDGSLTAGCSFTTADKAIADRIKAELVGIGVVVKNKSDKYTYRINSWKGASRDPETGRMQKTHEVKAIVNDLKLNCKSEYKFIPDQYKYASSSSRLELLRGLMDTDGTISPVMCVMEYYSVSKTLADDVAWLVRSLGGKAKITKKKADYLENGERVQRKLCYRVRIRLQTNPFWLKRKANRFYKISRRSDRVLKRIRPSRITDCRCITVDSPDNTYLCNDFIVTHNSFSGGIYTGLRLIPTDPNWECYKYGLDYHEWRGPQIAVVASYSWPTVGVIWETYRKILPREELGKYAPMWGQFPGEEGVGKNLGFSSGQAKEINLKCGSKIVFLCYTQSLGQWSGRQCDLAHLDEQCPEYHYEELSERQSTRGDYTPIVMTLTGHVIDDRPDTGAGGWIKTKIIDQEVTKGRKVGQYRIAIEDVPDVFMSKEKKAQKYKQWVEEPERLNDERALRTAEARYWGGWEVGGGAVFSEFNPEIHIIDPFDYKKYKPTYYRMTDHGESPCASALFAMMPWGDCVMVKEYYAFGRTFEENIVGIIEELSGNSRVKIDDYEDSGHVWPIYEERFDSIEPYASELDTRSFGSKVKMINRRNIGQMYNQLGMACTKSSGSHDNITIPLLKSWLGLDKEREHILDKIGVGYDENLRRFGSPRLYFFNTCENAINEITKYQGKDKDDHLISCCKFLTSRDRGYHGDYGMIEVTQEYKPSRCSETGY